MTEQFFRFVFILRIIISVHSQFNYFSYHANPNRPEIFGSSFKFLSDSLPSSRSQRFSKENKPKDETVKEIPLKEELYEQKSFLGRVSTAITIVDSSDGKKNRTERDNNTKLNSGKNLSSLTTTPDRNVETDDEETDSDQDQVQDGSEEEPKFVVQRQEAGNVTEAATECVGFELLQGVAEFGKGILKFVALASDNDEE